MGLLRLTWLVRIVVLLNIYFFILYLDLIDILEALEDVVSRFGVAAIIAEAFPTHKWKIWKFNRVPLGWWSYPENQRAFLQDFAHEHGITEPHEWGRITNQDIKSYNGMLELLLYIVASISSLLALIRFTAIKIIRRISSPSTSNAVSGIRMAECAFSHGSKKLVVRSQ